MAVDFSGFVSETLHLGERLRPVDENIKSINREFDKTVGVTKELSEQLQSLANATEASEVNIKTYEQLHKRYSEQLGDLQKKLSEVKQGTDEYIKLEEEESRLKAQQNKYLNNITRETNKINENKIKLQLQNRKGLSAEQVLEANKKRKEAIAKQQEGNSLRNLAKSPMVRTIGTVVQYLIKAIELGIQVATEYMVVNYQNQIKTMQALTTAHVNAMKAGISLWTNALNGSYEAQNLQMSSSLALIEAQNAITLANFKLKNMWTNWIPVVRKINEYREKEMELEQQYYEQSVQNAMKVIQTDMEYAKMSNEYLLKQDQAVRTYGRSVGLSLEQTNKFERRMLDMGESLAAVNRTIEDVLKIQQQAQQQSGRLINYSNADYQSVGNLGSIIGDENVANFEAEMVLFNQSVADSANLMWDMYKDAGRMGLSQKKVTQSVLNNLKLAEKYQFKGGIQGYLQLAQVAENLRFDLSKLGSVIEKIQTGGLEGVIKQSAQLQVLGGGYAMNADPLRMAFNAFRDPEGLVKSVADMARSEGVFNPETGEMEFGIGAQMRMNAAAQTLGLSREDIMNMAREEEKKSRVSAALKGSRYSEEEQNAIANGAQWDKSEKKWYVNTLSGQKVNIDELAQKGIKAEDIVSTNNEKKMEQYAQQTMSYAQKIEANTKYVSSLLGKENFDDFTQTVEGTITATKEGFEKNLGELNRIINKVNSVSVKATQDAMKELAGGFDKLSDAYNAMQKAKDYSEKIYELLCEQYKDAAKRAEERENAKARQSLTKEQIQQVESNPNHTTNDEFNVLESKIKIADNEMAKASDNSSSWAKFKKRMHLAFQKRSLEHKTGRTQAYKHESNDVVDKVLGLDNKETAAESTKDAIASAGGTPMAVAAKDITSIHDGLALADKRDSAVFAKKGGPFDTLFNGIFDRINAMYAALGMDNNTRLGRMMPIAMKTINEMPREMSVGERMREIASNGRRDDSPVKFEPLKVEMSGRLELSSGGKSVDIMTELQNNPLLVREIARMISDSLSSKFYGGKSRMNPGQNTYFK